MKRILLLSTICLVAAPSTADVPLTGSAAPRPAVVSVAPSRPAATTALPVSVGPSKPLRHRRHAVSPVTTIVASAARQATQEPVGSGFINAMQIYPYAEGAIYRLYAAPEQVTDIALQPGETLGAVASGDTVRWVIGDTPSGAGDSKRTHILVKPFAAGLSTNLVITTDRRTYHLAMTSVPRAGMTALSWTYPTDSLLALQRAAEEERAQRPVAMGIPLEALHFNYVLSGDSPPWRPLRAFDDGRQTYVEFPASLAVGEAPPLFLVDPKGEAQLVNYRVQGRFYVIDRIFDAAELRLGTKKQIIVRIDRVNPQRGQGGVS